MELQRPVGTTSEALTARAPPHTLWDLASVSQLLTPCVGERSKGKWGEWGLVPASPVSTPVPQTGK